jgi:hypothetical protein
MEYRLGKVLNIGLKSLLLLTVYKNPNVEVKRLNLLVEALAHYLADVTLPGN